MKSAKIIAGLYAGVLMFSGVAGGMPVSDLSLIANAAESGTCGENLTWTLDNDGTLTISGTGRMTDYSYSVNPPWVDYTEDIIKVVIEDGVTNIGKYAFNDFVAMTDIVIPDSVTSIGFSAFSNCAALTDISIPKNVTEIDDFVFEECSKLTKVTIPDGVTRIGVMSFYRCTSLSEITIPESVTSFGGLAFLHTPWLEMQLEGVQLFIINSCVINGEKCSGDLTIPDGITSISDFAFDGCKNLTGISIPESVTDIGESAFGDCTSLTSITIPTSVTSIGRNAFYGTKWLETRRKENPLVIVNDILIDGKNCFGYIVIPDGVTEICGDAFNRCGRLQGITIPKSVTKIGFCAFSNCNSLDIITILNPDCAIRNNRDTLSKDERHECTICGYQNSTAQAYAERFGYTFRVIEEPPFPDMDGNNEITASDAQVILTAYAELLAEDPSGLTPEQEAAADVDGNGRMTALDAQYTLSYFLFNTVLEQPTTWDEILFPNDEY